MATIDGTTALLDAAWKPRALAWWDYVLGGGGISLIAVLLARRFGAGGAEMDEGSILAYTDRILHGSVPWRDFQSFYGPGNVWLLAGVSKVFGAGVATERAVGIAYRLLIVLALFLLARRFGVVAAGLAIVLCAYLLPAQGVAASAFYGALALGLAGLALLVSVAGRPAGAGRDGLAAAAGALLAGAVLERFDFAAAAVLPAASLLPLLSRRARGFALAGFAAGSALYVPQLLLVGPAKLGRLVDQLRASEPGRRLPYPWPQTYPGNILGASIGATALLLLVGAALTLRRRRDLESRILLAGGLFSIGLLPTMLSRADADHVIPGAIVSLVLFAPLLVVVGRRLRARPAGALAPLCGHTGVLALGAIVVVVAFAGGPNALRQPLRLDSLQSYEVAVGGRSFPLRSPDEAADAQAVVSAAARLARPGQRLFVGPVDLRRTNYADTYIYYLLPKLRPASFYMELNPQTANRPGSGLVRELHRADWLILTSRYDVSIEPNSSMRLGSPQAGRVVRDEFCVRAKHGLDTLLQRCA